MLQQVRVPSHKPDAVEHPTLEIWDTLDLVPNTLYPVPNTLLTSPQSSGPLARMTNVRKEFTRDYGQPHPFQRHRFLPHQ